MFGLVPPDENRGGDAVTLATEPAGHDVIQVLRQSVAADVTVVDAYCVHEFPATSNAKFGEGVVVATPTAPLLLALLTMNDGVVDPDTQSTS